MPVNSINLVGNRTVAVGVHEDATPEDTRRRFPAARIGREFIPPLAPGERPKKVFDRMVKLAEPWRDGGVYVSYKPSPREVAEGGWKEVHREIGAWLADNPWVGIIVHHEPEGPRGLDGATFETMFATARDQIKKGWGGARVAYCAMAYHWRPAGRAAIRPDHWRRVVADEYLCDVYSGKNEHNGAFPTGLILPEHPGYTGWFNEIVRPRLAAATPVTYGLGERGLMGGDVLRAATIRRESVWLDKVFARYAADPRPANIPPSVYLAWSSPGTEHETAWVLTGDSETAMRELTTDFARHTR